MKQNTRLAVFGTVAAVTLSVAALSATAANDKTKDSNSGASTTSTIATYQNDKTLGQVERASQLIGKEVISSDNQKVGKLENLIVDLTSGRVLYAVIGSGGVLGAGEHRFAVAPGAFATAKGNTLQLNVDKAKLQAAPEFTKDLEKDLAQLAKADFVSKVYQYFGQNAWWQGANPADQGEFHNTHRATDAIGMKVQNVNNESLGKIDNLVVDLPDGRVVYAVLAPDSSLGLGKNLYALPPDALTLGSDKKTLVSDLSKEKLQGAPHFAKNEWQNLSNPAFAAQVYQYYGKQAYFSTAGTTATGVADTLQPTGRTNSNSNARTNNFFRRLGRDNNNNQ